MHKIRPKWLPIEGLLTVGEASLTFVGESKPKSKKPSVDTSATDFEPVLPSAIARSDLYFESGDVTGEIRISTAQMLISFRIGPPDGARASVGLGVGGKTYALAVIERHELREVASSGSGTTPPIDQWFRFRIRVRGSRFELFIEDVLVLHGIASYARAQLEIRLMGEGTARLRNITVESLRPQAFVVMQFTDEYTALFKEVIDPVCTDFGYEVIRGDNVYTNGLIIEDITRSIRECSLVVADITPNNANVYYELGYAHGIGKPAILLSDRNRDKLPFDISGFRLLFYDNTIGGKKAVEEALRKHLEAIRSA